MGVAQMMTSYCKMCGGLIIFQPGATIGKCEDCKSMDTLPKIRDETRLSLYNRATELRMNHEFDKAERICEDIVLQDDSEAEAYWGLVLCRYGVVYVEDAQTKRQTTKFQRFCIDPVLTDIDYKAALKYAC